MMVTKGRGKPCTRPVPVDDVIYGHLGYLGYLGYSVDTLWILYYVIILIGK